MVLTPEQMQDWIDDCNTDYEREDDAATLAAYVDIVQRVAETNPSVEICGLLGCAYCGSEMEEHGADCLYLAARKLRGYDG